MIAGAPEAAEEDGAEQDRVLEILLAELPLSQAVALAEKLTGGAHKILYKRALALRNDAG
jgi:16S rRNA (cytidine1402-2'-O)-methyltransferase